MSSHPSRPRPVHPARVRGGAGVRSALTLLLLGASASAQSTTPVESLSDDELRALLIEALGRVQTLEGRVQELESLNPPMTPEQEIEAQLQALLEPAETSTAPAQSSYTPTVFPSAYNPRIGVFADAVADFGNGQEKLGDGDRFSVRETELDIRTPFAPWGEGVLITAFEDLGAGETEFIVEEVYADLLIDGLTGIDTRATARLGRSRVPFGLTNMLHTHDLPQVDRPLPESYQLGEEGIRGDGIHVRVPLFENTSDNLADVTSLQVSLVNGEMFTSEEGILGELAADNGLELDSDAPVAVTRLSHYSELTPYSDLEVGIASIDPLASDAIVTDAGTEIEPRMRAIDATLRLRDGDNRQGAWVFQGQAITSNFDYGSAAAPGFPSGNMRTKGWSLSAQRQMGITTFVGVRTGMSEMLGDNTMTARDVSPYVSWYPVEFFRVRLQGQHLDISAPGGDESVYRGLLQFTWNFGAHQPHPYWINS